MTRRFIIHIGPAKTGTSSLQDALYRQRAALLQKGLHYPDLGRHAQMPQLAGHHGLPAVLRSGGALPAAFLDWAAAVPDDEAILLSSENFAHLAEPQIRALARQLNAEDIQPVYYARRWDRLMPSVWQELVKHGETRSYPEFLNDQAAAPRASLYLNFAIPLDRWAAVCGRHNIRLFSYDGICSQGSDVISHFFAEVLQMEPPAPGRVQSANTRLQPSETEVLRMLNRMSFGAAAGDAGVRQRLFARPRRVAGEMALLEELMQPFLRRCRPCAPLVLHRLEEELMQRYRGQLGNPADGGRLFAPGDFEPAWFCSADYLLIPEAAAALRRIHRMLELPDAAGGRFHSRS